jgi:hypothetical protein
MSEAYLKKIAWATDKILASNSKVKAIAGSRPGLGQYLVEDDEKGKDNLPDVARRMRFQDEESWDAWRSANQL